MTEQEKHSLIGRLVTERQSAKKELALLREKARRVAAAFNAVSAYMSDQADPLNEFNLLPAPQPREGDLGFDYEDIAQQIRDLRTKERDLERREKELGLR